MEYLSLHQIANVAIGNEKRTILISFDDEQTGILTVLSRAGAVMASIAVSDKYQ